MTDRPDPLGVARLRLSRVQQWFALARQALQSAAERAKDQTAPSEETEA